MMKYRTSAIITSEILMFVSLLTIIWVDEFLDMPYLLFGAPPAPHRLEEFIIESGSIAIVGLMVIGGTVVLLKRFERLERFLRVCAWCKKVWMGDRWVVLEEYVKKEHMLQTSHGICPECVHKMKCDAKVGP